MKNRVLYHSGDYENENQNHSNKNHNFLMEEKPGN
jgi:hypothetical protein